MCPCGGVVSRFCPVETLRLLAVVNNQLVNTYQQRREREAARKLPWAILVKIKLVIVLLL